MPGSARNDGIFLEQVLLIIHSSLSSNEPSPDASFAKPASTTLLRILNKLVVIKHHANDEKIIRVTILANVQVTFSIVLANKSLVTIRPRLGNRALHGGVHYST